jgi:hypothetical protein
MFYNVSNHPSASWSDEQRTAATELAGEIIDISFPHVSPAAGPSSVSDLAVSIVANRLRHCVPYDGLKRTGDIIFVAGESTLTHAIVTLCKRYQQRCVSATTERAVVETINEDGSVEKKSTFRFVRWREF